MASVRLGYCYYFLPLLLFFYTFQHPSPDSTTNSDRPIYRLNGQPKIGILLLFFTLAISFSINEYYLLYDTPLLENNTVLVYVRNNVTYLLTYSNLYCIGDSNHISEYEFQYQFEYGVHITDVLGIGGGLNQWRAEAVGCPGPTRFLDALENIFY